MKRETSYRRITFRADPMTSANDRHTYMDDLEECLEDLEQDGFTSELTVVNGQLYSYTTGKFYKPDDIQVTDYFRFEGISNPDDMSILYAIETRGGEKGTLIDAYGVYADSDIGDFMQQVELHKVLDEK